MPTQKADWFTRNAPDVRTGAVAGGPQKVGYSSGTSNPPNGGQITDIDNPEPNDTKDWFAQNAPVEIPAIPAGANGSLPAQPKAPIPSTLQGPRSVLRNFASAGADVALPLGDAGIGALKGLGSDALGFNGAVGDIPYLGKFLTPGATPEAAAELKKLVVPSNTAQSVGKGIEQAGEFLLPGLGEEAATAKLAEVAPWLGRAAGPLGRIGYNALTSGLLNKAQGGGFLSGAAMGGAGSAVGDAAKAVAPNLIEFGQGLHTPGAKTGKAILDETGNIFPDAIRRSSRDVVNDIEAQKVGALKAASVRPNPVRALLPPPPEEIPLGNVSEDMIDAPGQLVSPLRMPGKNVVGGLPDPRNIEQLGMDRATLAPTRLTRSAYLTGTGDDINDLNRSGPGVLLRRLGDSEEAPEIPAIIANRSISLRPAREVAASNLSKAFEDNNAKIYGGVKRLGRIVTHDLNGKPLDENVTPWKAYRLRVGTDNQLPSSSFDPKSENVFKEYRTAQRNALNESIGNVVPEYRPLLARESALIPATKPAKRGFGHLWGPGAGAIFGGYYGARAGARNEGGLPGAVKGGLLGSIEGAGAGTVLPALINFSARSAYNPALRQIVMPLAVGGALQATRKKTP